MPELSLPDRIAELDRSLFSYVESETTDDDRLSLLAIHAALAEQQGEFTYLEIGSHLGGTLQAVVADPRCTKVVSIDPRPLWQPDDRPELGGWTYEDNSTERMLGLLRGVPDANLDKLEPIEASTDLLSPARVGRPDFCFIDGEHTFAAALRDARFCRAAMQGTGVIAFHDFTVVPEAVLAFLRETPRPHRAYWLRSVVFVVELGVTPTLLDHPAVRRQLTHERPWVAANRRGLATPLTACYVKSERLRQSAQRAARRNGPAIRAARAVRNLAR